MKIDKDTVLCISIASRPGKFGMTVHNAAYQSLKLNFIYKAFRVENLSDAIKGVRAFGIKGCSITMPFKEKVIPYLDWVDPCAKKIGAVNTIVNERGRLKGYNSDFYGAKEVIQQLKLKKDSKVLLLGAGGAARAILFALKDLGFKKITVANRTESRVKNLEKIAAFQSISWTKRNSVQADLAINATSIGMAPNSKQSPLDVQMIKKCQVIMDTIVTPIESRLIHQAKNLRKKTVSGYQMSLYQAAKQFELYTGCKAPLPVMKNAILKLLKANKRK